MIDNGMGRYSAPPNMGDYTGIYIIQFSHIHAIIEEDIYSLVSSNPILPPA